MKKTTILLIFTLTIFSSISSQNVTLTPIIKNEKVKDFTISVYKGSSDMQALFIIKNDKTNSEEIFEVATYFPELKKAEKQIMFEDFNFDGKEELLILDGNPNGSMGFYIYDYNTLQPMELFNGKFKYENKEESNKQNYVFTNRGSYEFNAKDKTIKFSGSCGAMCGIEETYKYIPIDDQNSMEDERGKYKLVERREWNW